MRFAIHGEATCLWNRNIETVRFRLAIDSDLTGSCEGIMLKLQPGSCWGSVELWGLNDPITVHAVRESSLNRFERMLRCSPDERDFRAIKYSSRRRNEMRLNRGKEEVASLTKRSKVPVSAFVKYISSFQCRLRVLFDPL